MSTSPVKLTPQQQAEIAEDEATLDRLYPDWRLPPKERAARGGFAGLPLEVMAQVKTALKRRSARLAGRDNAVQVVFHEGRCYAHLLPSGVPALDFNKLTEAVVNNPNLRAELARLGVLA